MNIADYNLEQVKAWADIDQEAFGNNLITTHSRVVTNNEQIIGFGNIDDTGYLDLFYISANYQRQGAGHQLLNDLENGSVCNTITVKSSITAKPFFQKMGYKEVSENLILLRDHEFTNYTLKKVIR